MSHIHQIEGAYGHHDTLNHSTSPFFLLSQNCYFNKVRRRLKNVKIRFIDKLTIFIYRKPWKPPLQQPQYIHTTYMFFIMYTEKNYQFILTFRLISTANDRSS